MEIEEIEKVAIETMEKTLQHRTQIILEVNDQIDIILLMFRNDKEKEVMCEHLRERINEQNISRYFFITEGYLGQNLNIRPSEDPNRKEALIIQEYNRNLKNKSIIQEFTIKDKKVQWLHRLQQNNNNETDKSKWNFFVEDATSERISQLRKEVFLTQISPEKLDENLEIATLKTQKILKDPSITKEQIKETLLKLVSEGKLSLKQPKGGETNGR